MKNFFNNKVVVVFGGTGSIGSEIVRELLKYEPKIIRIFSNDENSLWEVQQEFIDHYEHLRFLLGDVREYQRVKFAVSDANFVFNAAAVKHVPFCEYNPIEAVDINIKGLDNIIRACFECKVEKLIYISTDKAVNPCSVMGATKMIGEKICISRELAKGESKTIISCVRFGNVLGSRGSIIPLLIKDIKEGRNLSLTDSEMTRFFMTVRQAVHLVLKAIELSQGGEIFVLKMPVFKIKDLFEILIEEYNSSTKINIVGKRLGEKIYEELIHSDEVKNCFETEDLFCIYPDDYKGKIYIANNKLINNGSIIYNREKFYYDTKNIVPLDKEIVRKLLKEYEVI